jgi:hypothetical protein
MFIDMQWCDKHIYAAVNQHATIEVVVFPVGVTLRLYNEDLGQPELGLRESLELAE